MSQSSTETRSLRILFNGKVQGVGFRAFVKHIANQLGLYGWVRNVGSDQVEAFVEGDPHILIQFLETVRIGPNHASVENVETSWEFPLVGFNSFEVRFR
jgi:acylphosphatase